MKVQGAKRINDIVDDELFLTVGRGWITFTSEGVTQLFSCLKKSQILFLRAVRGRWARGKLSIGSEQMFIYKFDATGTVVPVPVSTNLLAVLLSVLD